MKTKEKFSLLVLLLTAVTILIFTIYGIATKNFPLLAIVALATIPTAKIIKILEELMEEENSKS